MTPEQRNKAHAALVRRANRIVEEVAIMVDLEERIEADEAATAEYNGSWYTYEDFLSSVIEGATLSIEVRSDWRAIGSDDTVPTHYRVLLAWGGPALQITGELDKYGEVETAELQYQDWFTPWVGFHSGTEEQDAAILEYARRIVGAV